MTQLIVAFMALLSQGLPSYERPLSDSLQLSLATDHTSYYPREAIGIRLSLENTQSQPVSGLFMISPTGPKVEIHYRELQSRPVEWRYPRPQGAYGESALVLRHGEKLAEDALVLFDVEHARFVLERPGRYELKAVYLDVPNHPNAVLTSNVVGVEVMPPPADLRPALKAYTAELARSAQLSVHSSFMTPEMIKSGADFLRRFPASPYSAPLRHAVLAGLRGRVARAVATREERQLYEELQVEKQPIR